MTSYKYIVSISGLFACLLVLGFSNLAQADFTCDDDGDGYESLSCRGSDCNDLDATIHPGADELCDGLDNDCDGNYDEGALTNYYYDGDSDGAGNPATSSEACTAPTGYVDNSNDCDDANSAIFGGNTETCGDGIDNNCDTGVDEGCTADACDADADGYLSNSVDCAGTDCNDADDSIHPGATESCDTIDNDCDGTIDNGVQTTYYADADADGYGDSHRYVWACTVPAGYVTNDDDCNDGDAAISPAAAEICGDSVDENCSGGTNDGCGADFCDRDGDGALNDYCADAGDPNFDCNDADAGRYPGNPEICDEIDNDCSGTADDGLPTTTYYRDADGDGYGGTSASTTWCAAPEGFVEDVTDCDDTVATTYPGATEQCDTIDNDCDGTVDNAVTYTDYYADADGDGFGDPASTVINDCVQPVGYVADATDCDDTTSTINSAAAEVCDGVDNNCNSSIDDGVPTTTFYADADGDTFGDLSSSVTSCSAPAGYVADGTDCDDTDPAINTTAAESCDGVDNNCEGTIDEGCTTTVCDVDGDGHDSTDPTCAGDDCDDTSAAINPDADEICDLIDNNCDGVIDTDAVDAVVVFADRDGDTFGNGAVSRRTCARLPGFVTNSDDCNDRNAAVNPLADEVCGDGVDNNCNRITDGADALDAIRWYADVDGDTYGDAANSVLACEQPGGTVGYALDCNDSDAAINPLSEEVCGDRIDNDCNAIAEETCYLDGNDDDGDGYSDMEGDCDDYNANIYPGAAEVCDGLDNDCDSLYDDNDSSYDSSTALVWYVDSDMDGFGTTQTFAVACRRPVGNYSLYATDCNDAMNTVSPGATEICGDGIDNNCDTIEDTSCLTPEVTEEPDATDESLTGDVSGSTVSSGCSLNMLSNSATSVSCLPMLFLALFGFRMRKVRK